MTIRRNGHARQSTTCLKGRGGGISQQKKRGEKRGKGSRRAGGQNETPPIQKRPRDIEKREDVETPTSLLFFPNAQERSLL